MRFKTQLGIHPAWRNAVPVPVSLLNNYVQLGMDNAKLAYVLQIISAYWQGQEANHAEISGAIDISTRMLRNYNQWLVDNRYAHINGRYLHGNRLENDYDLTPLLDASFALEKEEEKHQEKVGNAYRLIDNLVNALENGQEVNHLLRQLANQWRENTPMNYEPTGNPFPVESGNPLPIESGNPFPVSIGNPLPVSSGNPLPNGTRLSQPETHFRLKEETHFLSVVVVPPNNNSLEETTTTDNIMSDLEKFGIANGDAKRLLANASKHFGENALTAVRDWMDYCNSQDNLTKPAGLIVSRIKSGETAPAIVRPVTNNTAVTPATAVSELIEV